MKHTNKSTKYLCNHCKNTEESIKKEEDVLRAHEKPKTDIEKWISKTAPFIVATYGLGSLTISYRTRLRTENSRRVEDIDKDPVFQIDYSKAYKTAQITIYPVAQYMWEKGEKDMLMHGIIHEFAHVITNDLAELCLTRFASRKELDTAVESTTESIAHLGIELLKSKYPKLFIS